MADNQSPAWTLTARWLLPIEGLALEHGTVTIQGERIVAVEPWGKRTADLDLGDVAVLPGFVNAHTHLDLGGLGGKVPPSPDFTAWLRAVVDHRRRLTPQQVQVDTRFGLSESIRHGTTLIGDIAANGSSWELLTSSPVRAVVFYELLGLPRVRAHQAWAGACDWLRNHPATATCRPGLSPHAPYSVRAALFRAAAALSGHRQIPLAIHLAETVAELELLRNHSGPFVSFLQDVGVWEPAGLVRSPAKIIALSATANHALFTHGNYLDATTPLSRTDTVVYCPRTHAAFGHPPHSFQHWLAAGVRVALGTDSLASNPDLSVLAEARFLHRGYPDVAATDILRMATLAGAEALGWENEMGSLAAGKSADLVVVPLAGAAGADPHAAVLAADSPVQAVLCRGRWVFP
jgi:cytosine/adenosine deaminase-related metal-dependent hydrolase